MQEHEPIALSQIGIVHSRIMDRRLMPVHGAPAAVEIFPAYTDGLHHVEENTHLWILGWYVGAERDQLQIARPEYPSGHRRRGVFGLRSTTRPNSLALSNARVLEVRGTMIELDKLDMLDGTPVLDIKRYSPSRDMVFSARSSREMLADVAILTEVDELEHAAAMFHGRLIPAVVASARLMQYVCRFWGVRPKDEGLRITVSTSPEYAVLVDAIQGMTAATLGSGRLALHGEPGVRFQHGERTLAALPRDISAFGMTELRIRPIEDLYYINAI